MRVAVALVLCAPLLAGSTWLMRNDEQVQRGQEAYDEGDYPKAAGHFRNAMSGSGDRDIIQFNLGTALARQGEALADPEVRDRTLALAIVALRSALDATDPQLRHSAYYNVGNALLLAKRYDEAVESYKSLLREDPSHDWARHNLELAQLLRRSELDLARVATAPGDGAREGRANRGEPSIAESEPEASEAATTEPAEGTPAQNAANATPEAGPGQGEGDENRPTPDTQNPGDDQAMRAEPRSMAAPQGVDNSGIVQKLDALERRSGELRRGRVLRKTKSAVRSFGQQGSEQ